MGAGILPTTIHNGKLYFLFGKENKYNDTPGWSDIGGGTDNNETFLETAMREGTEELTGFLGSEQTIKTLLKKYGSYHIQWDSPGHKPYRIHIFYMKYDPSLPFYYNNNHQFIERKLPAHFIKKSKIFEKEELKWVSVDDILKMHKRSEFRFYFQPIAMRIYNERSKIRRFINNIRKKGTKKKEPTRQNKTRKLYN